MHWKHLVFCYNWSLKHLLINLKLFESVALSYIRSINLHFCEILLNIYFLDCLYTKPGGLNIYSRNEDGTLMPLCSPFYRSSRPRKFQVRSGV